MRVIHLDFCLGQVITDLFLGIGGCFEFKVSATFEIDSRIFLTSEIHERESSKIVDTWILSSIFYAFCELVEGVFKILRIIVVDSPTKSLVNNRAVAGLRKRWDGNQGRSHDRCQCEQTKNYFPIHIGYS